MDALISARTRTRQLYNGSDMAAIAFRLREARTRSGMSAKDAARALQIDCGNLSHLENGHRMPSVASVLRFARLYKCTSDYILGLEDA